MREGDLAAVRVVRVERRTLTESQTSVLGFTTNIS